MIDNAMTTEQPQNTRLFNPNEHLIQIKNRGGAAADYLPVQWRLVWFRSLCPQGTIDTEELEVDHDREFEAETYQWNNETRRSEKIVKKAKGYARYKAIVTDGKGGRATGTKSERCVDFPDYIEKAETGAIGRALAALGYGTQFTGDEFDERHRIVDAPVDRGDAGAPGNGKSQDNESARVVSEQQKRAIGDLCKQLKKKVALPANYLIAKALIDQLTQELKGADRVVAGVQNAPTPARVQENW